MVLERVLRRLPQALLLSRFQSSSATFKHRLIKPYDFYSPHDSDVRRFKAELEKDTVEVNVDDAKRYLKQMMIIRDLENCAFRMYKQHEIVGFLHLYNGQEAVGVGIKASMAGDDAVIASYRSHGFAYLMGNSVQSILGEFIGSADGCSKGKGGSMHTYADNYYGGHGIVGAQVPLGTGISLQFKYRYEFDIPSSLNLRHPPGPGAHKKVPERNVCFALYGDGAANQGQVAESFDIAEVMKLPVIYVCENNTFGMGTAASRASANTEFYKRGDSIPGIRVNGMDVIAVREAVKCARRWCTDDSVCGAHVSADGMDHSPPYKFKGHGPIILEMETYRFLGHSMRDPESYRKESDVQAHRKDDPILTLKHSLLQNDVATEKELKEIEASCKHEVVEAEAHARRSPKPKPCELFTNVYSNRTDNLVLRGVDSDVQIDFSLKSTH